MWTFFVLELKGLYKEYRATFDISIKKFVLSILFIMSITLFFYVMYICGFNIIFILNTIMILTVFVAVGFKRDIYLEYLLSERSVLLKIFPRNTLQLIIIKGVKYELIVLFEIGVVLGALFFSLKLAGFSYPFLFHHFVFDCFLFLTIKNISSIIKHNKISNLKSLTMVRFLLRAIFFSITFILIDFSLKFFKEYLEKSNLIITNLFDNEILHKVMNILELFKINWLTVMVTLLFWLSTYILKIMIFHSINAKKRMDTYNWFLGKFILGKFLGKKDFITLKEYYLLNEIGILSRMFERVCIYIMATILIILFEFFSQLTLSINSSLFFVIIISEITVLMGTYTKSAIGNEKGFIINYILSDYPIANIIKKKVSVISIVLAIHMVIIYVLVSRIFNVSFLISLSFIPMVATFIIMYSFSINYFNVYKTSYVNQFKIPDKYAAIKIVILSSFVSYIDITIIFLLSMLLGDQALYTLVPLAVSFLHCIIFIFFLKKINTQREYFYGEYSNAIGKENR